MSRLEKITLSAFFTIILLIIFIGQVSAQDQTTITVTIKTKENLPLENAIVSLNGTIKHTGSDGKVTYTFPVEKVSNSTVCVYYVFNGHNVTLSDCSYYGDTTEIYITVDVVKSWPIRVWDHAGRDPVPNANVTIIWKEDSSLKFSKLTGPSGKAEFGTIPWGYYDISVKYGDTSVTLKDERPNALSGYKTVEELNVTLPLYRVTLKVLDKKGSPVKDVKAQLLKELDEEPLVTVTSDEDGKAVFKLIPKGSYYVTAYLKGIKVYQSEDKEISVTANDVSKTIVVSAAKLNITVYDYDGEEKITKYKLAGKLIREGEVVGEAETSDGILRFGHTPFADYTLKIFVGDLEVYSSSYEVNLDTIEKSIKAWFYDVTIKVNASALVNSTLALSLKGSLEASQVKLDFQLENGEARLVDVPRSETYTATLLYNDRIVEKLENVKIISEGQVVNLNLTGYEITVSTKNLDGEPVAANLSIILPGEGRITSFTTNEKGKGSSGRLLPLSYLVKAYIGGICVGEKSINLISDTSLDLTLSVMDVTFRILDKDGEKIIGNTSITLMHGKFKKFGESDQNGEIRVENIPLETYRVIVNYYGFKVFDGAIDVKPTTKTLEILAPGVLDARLIFLDAVKKPLDQGSVMISFGGFEFEKQISQSGEVVLKNLPNTTITVEVFYKGVKVPTSPQEFKLVRDDLRVTFVTSVYTLTAKILRGDGKDLDVGEALIYVNDELKAAYDLKEGNFISERLPQGDVRIQIKYRERNAGSMEIYLDKPIEDLMVYSTLFPFKLTIYNPEAEPVKGAEVKIADKFGEIASLTSDENGVIETLLPVGDYECSIRLDNRTYSFKFDFRKSLSVNFLYPVSSSPGFEIAVAAGAVNLFISGFALSKVSQFRAERSERRRGGRSESRRRVRRVPRV